MRASRVRRLRSRYAAVRRRLGLTCRGRFGFCGRVQATARIRRDSDQRVERIRFA